HITAYVGQRACLRETKIGLVDIQPDAYNGDFQPTSAYGAFDQNSSNFPQAAMDDVIGPLYLNVSGETHRSPWIAKRNDKMKLECRSGSKKWGLYYRPE